MCSHHLKTFPFNLQGLGCGVLLACFFNVRIVSNAASSVMNNGVFVEKNKTKKKNLWSFLLRVRFHCLTLKDGNNEEKGGKKD